jgi:signal transduction histidine kinase
VPVSERGKARSWNRHEQPAAPPDADERAAWEAERERLMAMLSQQQRVAQTGLITAGLVHEVGNHVMLIHGLAYLALRGCDPAKWRSTLQQVQAQCEELSDTMRTILAFAGRREEGAVATFRVGDVIAQAVRLLRPLARDRGVALRDEVRRDAVLIGEQRLLVQALVNLGSNAVRACDGRPGTVALRADLLQGRLCRIEVEDDGLGIPEHLRHRLFRPFVTGHAGSGGSGLGLFLVRRVVRGMGGSIHVTTSPEGTRFRLDVPATAPPCS